MLRVPKTSILCVRFKTSDSYQYLQRSKLPTKCFQASLPRLPIPLLEKTCERYLSALRPILSEEDYKKSEEEVGKFRSGVGYTLQKMLKDKDTANKETSYISGPWFDMYLKDRAPLPLNYNPLLGMKHDPRPEYNDQLIRASNLVITSLRFMKSLRAEILEPEVFHLNPKKSDTDQFRNVVRFTPNIIRTYVAYAFKAFPLDMSQYNGLFGTSRLPEVDKDQIVRDDSSKHLVVMRKGHFFTIDVLDDSGNILSPAEIHGRLKAVLEADASAAEFPLGVMTASNRNTWAKVRADLVQSGNEKQLQAIDSALFCLCLDEDIQYTDENPVPMVKSFLAGDATNRWFDKSVSLLIEKDGTAAINFEHSWGDGVAVLRYFNEIYNETIKSPCIHPDSVPNSTNLGDSVKRLEFNLTDSVKNSILGAKNAHKVIMDGLDLNVLRNNEISKNVCKELKVSPDSVMQLSFQLAYRQAFGKFVGTYESCSTAAFRHGRTETMRPCTMETKTFCDSILARSDLRPNVGELRTMIQNCSATHGNLTKEAAMGQGFDRHLFGLRHMAEINGLDIPDLYKDSGYKTINYNLISTSTLGSPALLAGAFGPVVPDGVGIGYSIMNDECGAVVSTYKGKCDGKKFIENLEDSFQQIYKILKSS